MVLWNILFLCVLQVSTCKPALGHSFAAGTTDGGGDLNFTQGQDKTCSSLTETRSNLTKPGHIQLKLDLIQIKPDLIQLEYV